MTWLVNFRPVIWADPPLAEAMQLLSCRWHCRITWRNCQVNAFLQAFQPHRISPKISTQNCHKITQFRNVKLLKLANQFGRPSQIGYQNFLHHMPRYAKICQVSSSQTFRFLWLGHLQGTGHVELRFELVDLTTQMVVLHFELLHFIQSLGSRMCSVPRYASLLFCKG